MTIETSAKTKQAVQDVILQNDNIQDRIRHIIVQALTEGKMEPEAIKQIIKDAIEAASDTVENHAAGSSDALKQVVTGVDAALSQAAEASKLAIEEATSNLQKFSDHDLKRALSDLQDLEGLFFDALRELSLQGKQTSTKTLEELLNHLQSSGSAVGESVNNILTALHNDLAQGGRLQQIHAADVAKAAGNLFARVSSGILAGLADTLNPDKK